MAINNVTEYTAAFSGCMSGLVASQRRLIDQISTDYTNFALLAGAFAQSFDQLWGNTVPDTLQVFMIEKACKAVWEERNNTVNTATLNPNTYNDLCASIIAMIQSCETFFTSQSVSPLPWPNLTKSWVTLLDLDLSSLPNQSFVADGPQTFGGFTWTKGNSANEAVAAQIINGQGLNFQPAAASDYNGGTRSLPYLWLPLAAVFGTSLSGLQWILTDTSAAVGGVQNCRQSMTTATFMGGDPTVTYQVTLRFRGIVETKTYTGGTVLAPFVNQDGAPDGTVWNVYKLVVSNPAHTYFLNSGVSGLHHIFGVDYQITIPIQGGASVTLVADSIDGQQIWSSSTEPPVFTPINVPGITSPSQPFTNGQFLQMDVISGFPSGALNIPLDWTTKIRLWMSYGPDNAAGNFDDVVFGIDDNSQDAALIQKIGFGSSGQGAQTFYNIANANVGFRTDAFTLSSVPHKTLLLQMEGLGPIAPSFQTFRSDIIQAGQQFPQIKTMVPGLWSFGGQSISSSGMTMTTPTSLGIILGAQRAGSGTAYSTTIQRIRLDYNNLLE
jgi:uncharacterized protein YceK